MIDIHKVPSPCYVMDEALLRKNLSLIKSVADRAGVEIILAFKSFAIVEIISPFSGNTFVILQPVPYMKPVWRMKNLAVRPILILRRIRILIFRLSCDAAVI